MVADPHGHQPASPLGRFLRLFADVRPGEGVTAVLLSLNIFLLLTAYYVLKPVREALILGQGSAELKSYMSAGMVVVLAIVVPLYGRLASRVPRRRLINIVTAIFTGCLVLFYALSQLGVPLGMVFFVWIGVFSVMIVAQFWGFANDLYTKDEGERLFPIVGFGASLGAVLGAVIALWLIGPFGIDQLMLVGAGLLVAQVLLTNYVDTRDRRRSQAMAPRSPVTLTASEPPPAEPGEKRRSEGAFAMVFGTPYLLMIGVMLMCLNWVNTTGEYILGSVISDVAREAVAAGTSGGLSIEEYIGQFYSQFFGVVNVAGVVIQLFLVSRIIKYRFLAQMYARFSPQQVVHAVGRGCGCARGRYSALKSSVAQSTAACAGPALGGGPARRRPAHRKVLRRWHLHGDEPRKPVERSPELSPTFCRWAEPSLTVQPPGTGWPLAIPPSAVAAFSGSLQLLPQYRQRAQGT